MSLTTFFAPVDEVDFELDDTTMIRALIGLYAGVEGKYIVRPAIYREE